MMTAFLTALLAASVTGSFVWLLLALLKPLTQKVFSQTWHYYTGLIPAFFLTGAAWLISSGINTAAALIRANAPAKAPSELNVVVAPPVFVYNSVIEKTGETVANARMSAGMLVPFIAAVWLIGCAVFLTVKVTAYVSFRRGISKSGYLSSDIACKLPVLVCPGVVTPMLAGVFKPVISMLMFTGLRSGELLALRWDNINFQQGTLTVDSAVSVEPDYDDNGVIHKRISALHAAANEVFYSV